MEIVAVDPFDPVAFEAWYDVYAAADAHGREGLAASFQLEEQRVHKQARRPHLAVTAWAGVVEGRTVVAGDLTLNLADNLERAMIGIWTHPEHRSRGHGSAMLAHLERVAREHGRSVLDIETAFPYDGPPDGSGSVAVDFLTRRGFTLALVDIQRRLDLPVAPERLDTLAAEAARHHSSYSLVSFVGPVPEEYLEGFARLDASISTEAPTGEREMEPRVVDVAVVRANEEMTARQGRTKYQALALDAAGQVVAYNELATTVHEPDRAYQWGTLVRPADRGHRLGLAVKVAGLRLLQAERPELRMLITYNAEVNRHMIGINERLGFRPVERLGEFQKRLPTLGGTE